MKTSRSFLVLFALPILLSGCGGSGAGAGSTIGVIAGRYAGTYESTGATTFNGTLSLTVDTNGQVVGTVADSRYGAGTLSGSSRISRAGRLSIGSIYAGSSPTISTATVANLTLAAGGVLTGSGRESRVTVSNPITITLTPDND